MTLYLKKYPNLIKVSRDKEQNNICFTIPFWAEFYPDKRNKWIMFNCARYKIEWLESEFDSKKARASMQ